MKTFYGKRITVLRAVHNIKMSDLAEKCQCSKQLISHFENGIRQPKAPIVAMLCQIFGVEKEFFYQEEVFFAMEKNKIFRARKTTVITDEGKTLIVSLLAEKFF